MQTTVRSLVFLALLMLGASVEGFVGGQLASDLSSRRNRPSYELEPLSFSRMLRPFGFGNRWDSLWDNIHRNFWGPNALDFPRWMPEVPSMAVDVKDGEKEWVVSVDVPGVNKEDVQVEVRDRMLHISAERKHESEEKDDKHTYHRIERSYGKFSRSLALPEGVDEDKVKAEMDNGVLTVKFVKRLDSKPSSRQIKVD